MVTLCLCSVGAHFFLPKSHKTSSTCLKCSHSSTGSLYRLISPALFSGRLKKEQALSRISSESLDKIPEEEEESPVFKELPGAKGTDEAVLPLTGSIDRSMRDSSGELTNQTNGVSVLPNGRVYGTLLHVFLLFAFFCYF